MSLAYLHLGSNIGDRLAYLAKAVGLIQKHIGTIISRSSLYETQAWGNVAQDAFYNLAVCVETSHTPEQILEDIHKIESEMGRTREEKWGPRTIDIDILLVDDIVVNKPSLNIPHKHMANRNFVLIPLMEIAGEVLHPTLEKTIEELYFDCKDEKEVILLEH